MPGLALACCFAACLALAVVLAFAPALALALPLAFGAGGLQGASPEAFGAADSAAASTACTWRVFFSVFLFLPVSVFTCRRLSRNGIVLVRPEASAAALSSSIAQSS
eukprot:9476268-Pyramimonas_sp.AAC.1